MKMEFNKNDIAEFKDLLSKGVDPYKAKEIIRNSKQEDKGGYTDAFIDIASNIYQGFENVAADAINIPLSKFTNKKIKPLREQLVPTGEEYGGGVLQKSADIIGKRGVEVSEAIEFGVEGEQSTAESVFQGVSKVGRGVLDVGGEIFLSGLSTLTPDKQKEQLINKVKEIAESKGGQAAMEFTQKLNQDYQEFKKANPRAGRNVDALGTFLEGALELATGYAGYKSVKEVGKAGQEIMSKGKHIAAEGLGKAEQGVQQFINNSKKANKELSNVMDTGKQKLESMRTREREVEEITGNILQPYKGLVGNQNEATKGLQRVLMETELLDTKNTTFGDVLINTKQLLGKYGRQLDAQLKTIPGTYKDDSIGSALMQLEDVYKTSKSGEFQAIKNQIANFIQRSQNEGLTAKDINDIKILHTKANKLFNDKGQQTGGFLKDDLQSVRKELKVLVENIAEENGITNIKELNKTYGELSNTRILLDNQIDNLRAYKNRTLPDTLASKIGNIIGQIPILSGGVRGVLTSLGVSLRSDKINPIEVQKRLPELLQELNKAGMSRGEIQAIEEQFSKALKALPAEGGTTRLDEPVLTQQTIDRGIIAESKKELENAKIELNTANEASEMYRVARDSIQNIDNPRDLLELKEEINDLGLARGNELKDLIDKKIQAINEINQLDASGEILKDEYGNNLIQSFKNIYKNELKLKTTKGADKYSKVEFIETPGFKRFSDRAQEFINENPWVGDKTVQDIYDEIKNKMLMEDINTLKKVNQLEAKQGQELNNLYGDLDSLVNNQANKPKKLKKKK